MQIIKTTKSKSTKEMFRKLISSNIKGKIRGGYRQLNSLRCRKIFRRKRCKLKIIIVRKGIGGNRRSSILSMIYT